MDNAAGRSRLKILVSFLYNLNLESLTYEFVLVLIIGCSNHEL